MRTSFLQTMDTGLKGMRVLVTGGSGRHRLGVRPPVRRRRLVAELSLARFRETLDQNLTATFLTARGFLAQLGEREGSLVLVGSTAGIFGEAGHADYAAAKSAILGGLLLSMKNEAVCRNPRTRVNGVAPGWTFTAMSDDVLDEAKVAEVTSTMALRKVATADDVAAQIVALASPALSGHVTGQVVTVAGGMEGRLLHKP